MDRDNESPAVVSGRIRAGEISALEATEAALARIESLDAGLHAFCEVQPDRALAEARAVDERIATGENALPLAGVPIGVKDLEDATGYRTTYGDPAHAADPPAAEDSVFVARLRAAGCVVVGKTNTPAYGFRAETENLLFGATRNPWSRDRTAGGSSGGSAAAVAAGVVPLATGSDGGGSIRIPSATCGISGFKVTNGVVPAGDPRAPAWGPYSTRGPMARRLADVADALDVVKGVSTRDLMSVEVPGSFTEAARAATLEGVRIAWSPTLGYATLDDAVREVCEAAMRVLEAHGARVEVVETVFAKHPGSAWVMRAAAGSYRTVTADPTPWDGRFDADSLGLARLGEHLTAADLLDGEAGAHEAGLRLAALFERFDLLACPGMRIHPPRVGEASPMGPGWAGDLTLPFNLTRTPAAVVPAGFVAADGAELPVGLQLVGPRLSDLHVMQAAVAAEQALGFVDRLPPP